MRYQGQVYLKDDTVAGIGPWVWRTGDLHAWIGPKMDWENAHHTKIPHYVPENKRNVVVQAGGNQGMYPRLLSDIFKRVYTFEPDPINFHCLVANCQRDNIVKMNTALGCRHEMVSVSVDRFPGWEINAGIKEVLPLENSHIPTFTVDDLELDRCDLLMLDVEGYEMNILKGAIKTIERYHPVIFTEYHPQYKNPTPFLEYFDYEMVDRAGDDLIFVHK